MPPHVIERDDGIWYRMSNQNRIDVGYPIVLHESDLYNDIMRKKVGSPQNAMCEEFLKVRFNEQIANGIMAKDLAGLISKSKEKKYTGQIGKGKLNSAEKIKLKIPCSFIYLQDKNPIMSLESLRVEILSKQKMYMG